MIQFQFNMLVEKTSRMSLSSNVTVTRRPDSRTVKGSQGTDLKMYVLFSNVILMKVLKTLYSTF